MDGYGQVWVGVGVWGMSYAHMHVHAGICIGMARRGYHFLMTDLK